MPSANRSLFLYDRSDIITMLCSESFLAVVTLKHDFFVQRQLAKVAFKSSLHFVKVKVDLTMQNNTTEIRSPPPPWIVKGNYTLAIIFSYCQATLVVVKTRVGDIMPFKYSSDSSKNPTNWQPNHLCQC